MADATSTVPDRLGESLLKKGLVTPERLAFALTFQKQSRERLGQTLLHLGFVEGMQLISALCEQGHQECIPVGDVLIDPRALHEVPHDVASFYRALPLARIGDTLVVAAAPAEDLDSRTEALSKRLGTPVEAIPVLEGVNVEKEIQTAYARHYCRKIRDTRIGECLVARGLLTESELKKALEVQHHTGQRFGDAVVALGYMSRDRFHEALAAHLEVPFLRPGQIRAVLRTAVARMVPRPFAEHNLVLPYQVEGNLVRVLTASALDGSLTESILKACQARQIECALATPEDLRAAIRDAFRAAEPAIRGSDPDDDGVDVSVDDKGDLSPATDNAIVALLNDLLFRAMQRRASDIHVEQYEKQVVTRFRIDGVLQPVTDLQIDRGNIRRLTTRLKLDCKLDIAERRKPQDGSFIRRFGGRDKEVDFRVALQPTPHGENVVIRILDRTKALPKLEEIGFHDEVLALYRRMLDNPQGMILFTGPTGSGKTTSLYATLDELRKRPIKIVTAEDPVEYFMEGIQQCQVNDAIGNTFARYLRGFLRQDPDVILVGEMRDNETADCGVRAAMTGHLVFSTLHTNDTIGAVYRFLNMEVEPDTLASSLLCVISQRLVRRVCKDCVQPASPAPDLIAEFYPGGCPPTARFSEGKGCGSCDHTGFRGRTPIFEFWEVTDAAKALIQRAAPEHEIRAQALQAGMRTMVEDALKKAEAGVTTLSELREEIPYLQILAHQRHSPPAPH